MTRILPICVLILVLCSGMTWAKPARYRVTMEDPAASSLRVEAEFELESEMIGFQITSSPELPNGQADLLRDLQVRRHGEVLEAEAQGMGDWKIVGAAAGERVTVQYEILLEHENYGWGPGIDEVAYRTDEGLFFTGASLFMIPGYSMPEGARVEFDLPDRWTASVPWPSDESGAVVAASNDLLRNCLFMGTHNTQLVELDGFRFTMVIGGDLWEKRQLFVDAMKPVLPAAKAAFGGMPRENRFLVVFNRGRRTDGGAFASSYSMLLKGTVNESSSVLWGHGIAHEIIHFWNGHSFAPKSQDEEWLKEGFTDYLTILVRSRSGLDGEERVYRKLENCMRRYALAKLLMGSESTLREAGHNKHRERMLVYGGGALVGIALDVRIREATANDRGIDDFLGAMFAEFGSGARAYDLEDVVRVAGEISGEDQSEFFADYVADREFLDLHPYMERIGLQLDTAMDEFYLSVSPDSTPQQTAMRTAMFGERPRGQ